MNKEKDITLYIAEFLYRIRYRIFFGSLIVALLVAYFTKFLPQKYTVQTSIYTGIASASGLSEEKLGYFEINNMFDNIIYLTKAKGTLEKVSIRLFAINMINGDIEEDNLYISADNYKELLAIVPREVLELIDETSIEKTVHNLEMYQNELPGNFLFTLFNNSHPHYSYNALNSLNVKRVANSDVLELSYTSDDPGISLNTVKLVTEELINAYESYKYRASNDVVAYYEEQLRIVKRKLNGLENDLTSYNIEHGVINYTEQTKAIAISYTNYEDRLCQVRQDYESSSRLLKELEIQMGVRADLLKSNSEFVAMLDTLSTRNARITEIEMFNTEQSLSNNEELAKFKAELSNTERSISRISDDMNKLKVSKEGVAIEDMVIQWLQQLVKNVKTKAELKVLNDRRSLFVDQYRAYSPVGAEINKREREIRVTEESYLEILHALNLAKLKQKNIQISSATLNVVSPPSFPMNSDKGKRMLLILAALFGSGFFLIAIHLIIELLDRTLRDPDRARRLTSTPILSVFTGFEDLKYRGYSKACYRICANDLKNKIKLRLNEEPILINIFSIDKGEGKSFILKYLFEELDNESLPYKYINAQKELNYNYQYSVEKNITNFPSIELNNDVKLIFIEHSCIKNNSLPVGLIESASLNLVVMNAQRVWTESCSVYLSMLKSKVKDASNLSICLNYTSRDVAETYLGQLPPYKRLRSISYNYLNLGLTSRINNQTIKSIKD